MSRRLLASYLALTVAVLVALEVPLAIVNARAERRDLTAKVERDAFAAASLAEDSLQSGKTSPTLRSLAVRYRRSTGGRIVIVDRRGRSIADSAPTTPGERSFVSRPEIAAALRGQTVEGIRFSQTLHARLLYVAVPVASAGRVFGAVRITYPTSTLDSRTNRYRFSLLGVALIVLAAATVVGLLLARSVALPLRRLEAVAARIGAGELDARASEDSGPPEVRGLARQLNRTTAQLSALITSQDQFVADASHELRTPLTALRLRLENGETEAAIEEVERLSRLVEELLALARADAEGGVATAVGLGDVVTRRVELWTPYADEHDVALTVVDEGAIVSVGLGRVEQILDNLLANAIEASPPGSTVSVSASARELHVVDEGAGLSEAERRRAFDRFWRAGTGPGSGLGLAISKRLVEVDGGTIELRAAAGGGIDAVVRYP
ncbi:MAG TPA: ATP-binding protein [Gaiellaceae bacterium]|nr:ATP-binding protein [Gaiellaceae bacterium]